MPLPDQARKPLTSTTGTITQGPSSLKLRRADPSQGKCEHALPFCTEADDAPIGLEPLRGPLDGSLRGRQGLSPGEHASSVSVLAALPQLPHCTPWGPKDVTKRGLWPR